MLELAHRASAGTCEEYGSVSPEENRNVALIVDDHRTARYALGRLLASLGFLSLEAENAPLALRMLQRNRVSIVICDQTIPGGSGLELLSAIRLRHPSVCRVLLTGHSRSDLETTALRRARRSHQAREARA
jgi:DNA-binding NtrC family response regulator